MKYLNIVCIFVIQFLRVNSYGTEVDVSWDFLDNFEGWANATAEEMQMQVSVESGELRASIIGDSPNMDSPLLKIDTTQRHFCVIRIQYLGGSSKASLMLRNGPGLSDTVQMDYGLVRGK